MSKLLDLAAKLSINNKVDLKELVLFENVMRQIGEIKDKVASEKASHQKKMTALKSELEKIQATCRHNVTKYTGDPSGGSDSQTICEICEKDLSGKNVRFT